MCAKISPAGDKVVHLTPDGRLEFWNVLSGRLEYEWVAPQHLVFKPQAVEWVSEDVVAYGSSSGETCFLEFARSAIVGQALTSHGSGVLSLAVSNAGSSLFVGHEDGYVHRWSIDRKSWSGAVEKYGKRITYVSLLFNSLLIDIPSIFCIFCSQGNGKRRRKALLQSPSLSKKISSLPARLAATLASGSSPIAP